VLDFTKFITYKRVSRKQEVFSVILSFDYLMLSWVRTYIIVRAHALLSFQKFMGLRKHLPSKIT